MAGVEIPVEFASIRAYIRTIHGGPRWLLPAELAFLDEIVPPQGPVSLSCGPTRRVVRLW